MRTQRTMCRICEALCGLEVTVGDDERIVDVKADRGHPVVMRGDACVKGTGLGELHHDPDRLDHPMKRVGDRWEQITWDRAIAEIGARVRELRDRHGDRSIALYTGNPTFFSFQNFVYSAAFLESLGSPNHFASHSIDVNTKFFVSQRMYGLPIVHPVPDLERCRLLVIVGSNPAISQMSVINAPNALARLRKIEQRGGRVVVVDPRRTETAEKVGEHRFIRPGTDAYLLAAIAHVVCHEVSVDVGRARLVADGVDAFIASVRDWTPERVAPITGIDAETIRRLGVDVATTDGAALYCSTGVNMGPFGSLAYWFIQGVNLLTGNTDAAGGLSVSFGPFDALTLARLLGLGDEGSARTLVGGWHRVAATFPVGVLADEITVDHPERVRALIVSAGNPLHSVPGGELDDALDALDLLVAIDIYPSETAQRADYVLPAADMLERSDYPPGWATLQPEPYMQWTPPVVAPLAQRRPEWQIFSDLAVACGAPALGRTAVNVLPRLNRLLEKLPGDRRVTPDTLLALLLRWGGRTSMSEVRAHPEGVSLSPTEPGSFLGKRVPTPDGMVALAPRELLADMARLETAALGLAEPPTGTLALIGRRERRSHNSWMHNNPGIRQPVSNTALLSPKDARDRDIDSGDRIEIVGNGVTIELPVAVTDTVLEGVVVVPHGWGHSESGLGRAGHLEGANANALIAGGDAWMEPVSGQSVILAHRVHVRRAGGLDTSAADGERRLDAHDADVGT